MLCLKTQRRLNADSTVQHEGHVYLVEDRLKAQTVTVHQRLDGSIQLRCHNRSLSYRLVPQRPRQAQPMKSVLAKTTHRPAAEHPWRGSYKRLRPERHSRASIRALARGALSPFPNSVEPLRLPAGRRLLTCGLLTWASVYATLHAPLELEQLTCLTLHHLGSPGSHLLLPLVHGSLRH